jgi:hypothetical protein
MNTEHGQEMNEAQRQEIIEKALITILTAATAELDGRDPYVSHSMRYALDIGQLAHLLAQAKGDSWEEKIDTVIDSYFNKADRDSKKRLRLFKSLICAEIEKIS